PQQIENGDQDANRFGAKPVEPADCELALLIAGEAACARQEAPPMLADDLQSAIGPAITLLLERLVGVGQQAVTVALVGVLHLPAMLQHGQPEVAVFDDSVARPAADAL